MFDYVERGVFRHAQKSAASCVLTRVSGDSDGFHVFLQYTPVASRSVPEMPAGPPNPSHSELVILAIEEVTKRKRIEEELVRFNEAMQR